MKKLMKIIIWCRIMKNIKLFGEFYMKRKNGLLKKITLGLILIIIIPVIFVGL